MNFSASGTSRSKKSRKNKKLLAITAKNKQPQKIVYDSVTGLYLCYHLMVSGDSVIKQESDESSEMEPQVQLLTNGDKQMTGVNFYKNRYFRTLFKRTHPNYAMTQKEFKQFLLQEYNFSKTNRVAEKFEEEIDSKFGILIRERVKLATQKKPDRQKLAENYKKIISALSKMDTCVTTHEFDIYMDYLDEKLVG